MIELKSGHYVRVNDGGIDGEALPLNVSADKVRKAAALPAAVLVFRDGHREEVRDYTIANGMLYARGDFYSDGYWNKNIDLAAVNLPETLHANAERNVKFALPSSPNEVITRF